MLLTSETIVASIDGTASRCMVESDLGMAMGAAKMCGPREKRIPTMAVAFIVLLDCADDICRT